MVIINDTNIWIDLKLTNIIEKVFLLPYELAVPDILYNDNAQTFKRMVNAPPPVAGSDVALSLARAHARIV